MSQLASAHVTSEELAKVWDMFPNQDFITAAGAVIMLKKGFGQERNEPFAVVEAPAMGEVHTTSQET